MARGNPNIKDYSPMVNNTEIDTELNAKIISCVLENFNTQKPDLFNPDTVKNAINNYFQNCISKGLRPGNLGLYNALDLTKKEVYDLIHGLTPKKASCESIELIKKACKSMSEYREILGSTGKLSPPVLIFWQKNYDGLEDVQRIDIDANTAPKESKSPEEIKKELVDNLPIESDYKEL